MDSMKSLNRSLPRSPKQQSSQPPEQLLQAFRSAALSVTTLYKTAATDQSQARNLGYRDALENLLTFLDKENLGLGDGEGWKVRQWATERLDLGAAGSDSDDDRGEVKKKARSHTPPLQRRSSQEMAESRNPALSASPTQPELAPPIPPTSHPQPNNTSVLPEVFTFKSSYPYPTDVEMQASTSTTSTSQADPQTQAGFAGTTPTVRLEVVPRGSRTPHRNGNHSSKHSTRSATSTRSIGSGAGSKRKFTFTDYFDLGNFGDGKDGSGAAGGGKRGRFV